MRYEIILAPEGVEDTQLEGKWSISSPRCYREALPVCSHKDQQKPDQEAAGHSISRPRVRLRVDEVRVLYDVTERVVEVLAIVHKSEAQSWLEKVGESDESNRSLQRQG